jgi:hypothetical protein
VNRRQSDAKGGSYGNKSKYDRLYVSLTDKVLYDHLAGKQTIGVYPFLPGDLCWFLAVDFDGTEWVVRMPKLVNSDRGLRPRVSMLDQKRETNVQEQGTKHSCGKHLVW